MLTGNSRKVVVTMSGGVDSSVAAAVLKEQGYDVIGVTMKIWGGLGSGVEGRRHGCYGPGEAEDIEDARRVARVLGIQFHVFDLAREYQAEVLDYFRQEYRAGRTPNPCLRCNHRVKFGALMDQVQRSGIDFDYVASGHYARVEYDEKRQRYLLKKASDSNKDQAYFLAFLTQDQLRHMLFPLGDKTKEEARRMAAEIGLGVECKAESQDFVSGSYSYLLPPSPPGRMLDREGNVLGEHRGIAFYTIGQRKGLGIALAEPQYVIDIDPEENTVTVGGREELYQDELTASGLNWIAIDGLRQPMEVEAKIRYRHAEARAVILPMGKDRVMVKFQEPQMAVTPGQAVVFYQGGVVIGAGTIERKGA